MFGSNHILNLVLAILLTVLCCQPLGIISIVFAAIGMSRQGSGDLAGAESAGKTSLICTIVFFAISVFFWGFWTLLAGLPFFLLPFA